jgi:hypothetical protein
MFRRSTLVSIVVLLALALGVLVLPAITSAQDTPMDTWQFRADMRKLWEDHIQWTRNYIISVAADLPDADLVAERLLRNQDDIGNAIRPFYGDEAADQLAQLLRDHIRGAVDILIAAKAGDTAAMDTAVEAWRVNGDDIATFLNGANPDNWALEDLQAAMQMHLDLVLAQAQARLDGDYAADIAAYDQGHDHILEFADVLSNGIIAQFPDMFTDAGTGDGATDTSTDTTDTTDTGVAAGAITISLTGAEEVPGPGDEDATGTAVIYLRTDSNEVCVDISVQNITLPATAAHIHQAPAGQSGPPVVTLNAPDANGLSSTCATVEAALMMELVNNPQNFYVNIHNADFPDGAARGQLVFADTGAGTETGSPEATPESDTTDTGVASGAITISLTGAEEVPGPGDEDATGTAVVYLRTDSNEVCVDISVQNITLPAAAAHIHQAPAGQSGPPVVTLNAPDANGLSSTCATVEAALMTELVNNPQNFYVNVHNADFPDGAARGQLG